VVSFFCLWVLVSCFVFYWCYWVVSGLASLRSGLQGDDRLAARGGAARGATVLGQLLVGCWAGLFS
jgi:hypothetical protein